MQFHGERHSGYFRRWLQAVAAAGGDGPARARLAALATAPLAGAALAALAADVAVPGDTGATLRRVRTWLMLTLIERDLAGAASLDEVCATMTGLAEWATGRALHGAAQELAARHGRPLDAHGHPQDLLAIGMGKAGGNELNVSSDLDLVFVFRDEGESEGVDGAGRIASSEWMHRLARRTSELLA